MRASPGSWWWRSSSQFVVVRRSARLSRSQLQRCSASMPSALCRLTLGEVQTPGSSSTPHDQVAMLSVHVGSCSYRYLHAVHGNAGPVSCAVVNNELHGGGWATGSLCAAQVHLVLQSLVESTEARLPNLVRTLTKRFSQVSATQECSPRSITSAVD